MPLPPNPSVPCAYVSGTITVPAGKSVGVLDLIWQQLAYNCPGTSVEFRISADSTNTTPVFIGTGTVSCSNYGGTLTPMGGERKYRASYPGHGTPQGLMQVFAEIEAKLHIEVNT